MNRRSILRGSLVGALGLLAAGCKGVVPRALAEPSTPGAVQRPSSSFDVAGKIAYVKRGDVWVWEDGKARQVTRGNHYDGPAWSPDGTAIAASLLGENHSDVVLLDEHGNRTRQLTRHLSNASIKDQAWGRKPAWSPDGLRIAYISDQGPVVNGLKQLDMSLFVVDAGGGTPRKLMVQSPFSGGLDWPTWSSNGVRIAYTAFDSGPSQIQVYNLNTREWRNLTDHPGGAYDPAWSPDGKWIAYTVREQGKHDLYVMAADGTAATRITETGANRAPCWSPGGDLLAYVSLVGDSFEIVVVSLGFGDVVVASPSRQLTRGEGVDAAAGLSWVR